MENGDLAAQLREIEQLLARERQARQEAEGQAARERQARQEESAARQEAEAQAARERQARQEAEALSRPSTISEYLLHCHTHLFEYIQVETDKRRTTKGDGTSVKSKTCPDTIRPWTNFLDEQSAIFERLFNLYPLDDPTRVFESLSFVEGLQSRMPERIGSEDQLKIAQKLAIEDPVSFIVKHLATIDTVRREFTLPQRIRFDNNINTLDERQEEVAERMRPSTPETGPSQDRRAFRPDQICVYINDGPDDRTRPALVVEYKPPHKVTTAMLRVGLHEMKVKDVINATTMPHRTDEEGLFQYHAKRVVAAILTQTFSYMLQAGTFWGYLTTGEAMVFLRIHPADISALEYHLAEPGEDVRVQQAAAAGEYLHRTAVSQALAFCLGAMELQNMSQELRQEAEGRLGKWELDYQAIMAALSETPRARNANAATPGSEYVAKVVVLRKRSLRLRGRRVCNPSEDGPDEPDGPDGPDGGGPNDGAGPPTPTPRRSRRLASKQQSQSGQRQSGQPGQSTASGQLARMERKMETYGREPQAGEFCTATCLLGLQRGGRVDRHCPNLQAHLIGPGRATHHRLSGAAFHRMVQKQLAASLDVDFGPLWLQGARGALFWLRVQPYGYVLVAKATREVFQPELQHEAEVYRHLWQLQGRYVPVCLGVLDLVYPYWHQLVPFRHLLLLSWGGVSLCDRIAVEQMQEDGDRGVWELRLREVLQAVGRRVKHGDIRVANVLWDRYGKRLQLIDFERAVVGGNKGEGYEAMARLMIKSLM